MQTPQLVLDHHFLDTRHALLEIGAMLDRFDAACSRSGETVNDLRWTQLQKAVMILADSKASRRAEKLLHLFSEESVE